VRIFVTGASGYIGIAVVQVLTRAGHEVTGLYTNPEKEGILRFWGAEPLKGGLENPSAWEEFAAEHDAIVHIGMSRSPNAPETDRRVVEAMLSAAQLKGLTKSFIYTSGVWVLGDTHGKNTDESSASAHPAELVEWRPVVGEMVLNVRSDDLATAVIRPGLVYGGKAGIVSMLFESASKDGAAWCIGDGQNHWSLVYLADLAQLYRLVIEKPARGIFHGVDNHPLKAVEIAKAASRAAGKNTAVKSLPLAEARKQWGLMADALLLDQNVVSRRSHDLGWKPSHSSFLKHASEAFREWSS
jgi:nucleoside-diphosphate-sugar epimerase